MDFKIRFRAFQMEDVKFINRLRSDQAMDKLIGGMKRPVSLERDTKWVEDIIMKDNPTVIYFAVTLIDNNEIIGYTSISDIDY